MHKPKSQNSNPDKHHGKLNQKEIKYQLNFSRDRERESTRSTGALMCLTRTEVHWLSLGSCLWCLLMCSPSIILLLLQHNQSKLNYKQQPPQTSFLLSFLIYSSSNLSLSLRGWVQFSSESWLFAKKEKRDWALHLHGVWCPQTRLVPNLRSTRRPVHLATAPIGQCK